MKMKTVVHFNYIRRLHSALRNGSRLIGAAAIGIFLVGSSTVPAEGGWSDVVTAEPGAGWQAISLKHAWDAGANWKWLPEAGVWIYVVEPVPPVDPAMVLVEGGTLELSVGVQTISSFHIGLTEVTWGEWQSVVTWAVGAGYQWTELFLMPSGCADDHPVHQVSWYDAVKWCNAKSEKEGLVPVYRVNGEVYRSGEFGWDGSSAVVMDEFGCGYRLPTEAEWEFAARGGIHTKAYYYSGGDDLDAVGWFSSNSSEAACPLYGSKGTWPVGLKQANELGLYDMSGNISEWCWDLWSGTQFRLIRGGSWSNGLDQAALSYRNAIDATTRNNGQGFRLARN
jgi:formylglycine-generating enzyme required for sulfatase activity